MQAKVPGMTMPASNWQLVSMVKACGSLTRKLVFSRMFPEGIYTY
jgi:hypothetical protein